MDQDQIFKRACEQWHVRFSRSLRAGRESETAVLQQRIGKYAEEWRKHLFATRKRLAETQKELEDLRRAEASAYRRYRLLLEMFASMKRCSARTAAHGQHLLRQQEAAAEKNEKEHGGENGNHA